MCSKSLRFVHRNRRSRCRARIIVAILCLSSSALFQACPDERRESLYSSLADAVKFGEITRGWIPSFLRSSSRAIHVFYNVSSPRTWCAFEFFPDDSQRLRENLTSIDTLP